ncbi:ANTAR domain-containing response regulator [Ancylobacter rudongensis]|uniref:Two-component response regulator, AmiR/NasT family, consists of REC and RNA-binding antiterminator (ANTAR) domains n=1 Tax=Ancylobacter rudongensis TaxID=177413 RepID=A0A1G4UT14_9HYPH|nr:ANTAR domain-containing protein [Ancylobacter rudongensis]SCW96786.1 Two-component response regulator, AmiR/NasT family, consists of REC and RNA-binding antiterminator (ANTAR) domains [Ancylobacter rudongensis]
MAMQVLKDLRGLRVSVIHPPDEERPSLVEHLRRIGCTVEAVWPVPAQWPADADVVLLAIEPDARADIARLLKTDPARRPTLIAIVGYENPATLQIVLEAGAVAVVERPIRPFGLLTQLTIARTLWLEREEAKKRVARLEHKLAGLQTVQRAKSILMENLGLSEEDAYQSLRRQAMAKRVPLEDMAASLIHASELLQMSPRSRDMRAAPPAGS